MRGKILISLLCFSLCPMLLQAGIQASPGQSQQQSQLRSPGQSQQQDSIGNKKLKLTGGPILETNISGFVHSRISEGESQMKIGTTLGGFLNLGMAKSFSAQGELLFHHKTSDFAWGGHLGNYRYWGAEIAIYAMYHIHFAKGRQMNIAVGPYTEFGFKADYKQEGQKADLYEKNEETNLPIMHDTNSGFGIKLGYEFVSGLQINLGYKISVSNLLDENIGSARLYPHTFHVGLAYRFGK